MSIDGSQLRPVSRQALACRRCGRKIRGLREELGISLCGRCDSGNPIIRTFVIICPECGFVFRVPIEGESTLETRARGHVFKHLRFHHRGLGLRDASLLADKALELALRASRRGAQADEEFESGLVSYPELAP